MVLAVLLGVLYGLVSVAGSVFDGDNSKTAADSTVATAGTIAATGTIAVGDDPSVSGSGGPVVETNTPATTAAIDTTILTTTTLADVNTVPTAADPARVLLLGDSEAGGLSPFLQDVLDDTGIVAMDVDYKSSTGLVRPDYFDWPARLRERVPVLAPDIVVALFGGNDGQPFLNTVNNVDTPEWRAEYATRVAEVIDILTADGRTLIWVGVPNAEDESLTANLQVQNEVAKTEVGKHSAVTFVDAWGIFTGIDGGFAPNVMDPRDGEFKPVRSNTDGFHLNVTGEEILAFEVGRAVIDALRDRGAAI
ncbi:MAG: DUF459 domain-containing protein [Ilumatobacteraceae bacterium]